MSRILIGIIVVMGLGSYFLYSQNQRLVELNKAFEIRNAEQIATIAAQTEQFEKQTQALSTLTKKNQEIEADMNRYLDIFRRHNLTKLAAAKPGLIEPRMNKATKEVFDGIENDSNLISDLNN
jgi:hypothetical protein|tara:strand:- start:239 stop:607 length:369 start_codon:yes stop_codon:yes gene_type:complete